MHSFFAITFFFSTTFTFFGKIPQGKFLPGNVSKDLALIVRSGEYTLCESFPTLPRLSMLDIYSVQAKVV